MQNKKNKIIGWRNTVLLFVCLCLLLSCGEAEQERAHTIGTRIFEAYGEMPPSVVYDLCAEEWEKGYLAKDRFAFLLGEEGLIPEKITDAYICMAGNVTCCEEIMVFTCRTRSDASYIAKLCLSRAKTLDRTEEKAITSFAECNGRTVIYMRVCNIEKAKSSLKKVIASLDLMRHLAPDRLLRFQCL